MNLQPGAPFTVILPASNEAAHIGPCLAALLAQDQAAGQVVVVVAANACRDATVAVAQGFAPAFAARGWRLVIDDSPIPGKLAALNRAEALVPPDEILAARAYLDADVICDPALLGQVRAALNRPEPAYATGTLAVTRAQSWVTRAYASLWTRLPFVTGGGVGAGFFAVNPAGRARWGAFPPIISDDTFVRLHFAPGERHEVPARYHWPLVEGLGNLIRVRRRQDAGVTELRQFYPELLVNEAKPPLARRALWRLPLVTPFGCLIYATVQIIVRLTPASTTEWSRGR